MPDIKFPSEWLKAGDNVKAGDLIKFLDEGHQDENGQWIFKVQVLREGTPLHVKKFSLNKKNFNAISAVYGGNSDNWVGKEMVVRVIDIENPKNGELVKAVRLSAPGAQDEDGEEVDSEEDGF